MQAQGVKAERDADGSPFPASHRPGDPLLLVFSPAGVPEMKAEPSVEQGGENVGQKLNYNVGHPEILLEAYLTCSTT